MFAFFFIKIMALNSRNNNRASQSEAVSFFKHHISSHYNWQDFSEENNPFIICTKLKKPSPLFFIFGLQYYCSCNSPASSLLFIVLCTL